MDWIKKNYEKAILGLLSLALIGISVLLYLNTQSFGEKFSDAMAAPSKSKKIPEVDTAVIDSARQQLTAPKVWASRNHDGLLFTSARYTVKSGVLVKSTDIQFPHSETGEPITSEALAKFDIALNGEAVLYEDPDGDGFMNQDELRFNTDPTKKDSHPAYITRLYLSRWIKVQFRLKFQAYDGNINIPEKMEFQINPVDAGARTEFVKIGDIIVNTKFKVLKFEFKEAPNPSTGEKDDVSELTVVNTETNETVALILNKVVDSPNQFAEFEYKWGTKINERGQVFTVPKLKEFVLKPEVDQKYKLVDVNQAEAVIETPKGDKVSVKPYPKK